MFRQRKGCGRRCCSALAAGTLLLLACFMGGGVGSFAMYITAFSNFTTWFDEIIASVTELRRMARETDDYRDLMELPEIEDKSKATIEKIECMWFKYKNMTQYVLKEWSKAGDCKGAV